MKDKIKKQFRSILGTVEGKLIVMTSEEYEAALIDWLGVYSKLIAIAEDFEEYFKD